MKQIVIIIAAIASILTVSSCNKEETPIPSEKLPIKFNITVTDPAAGTRALKSGWENGDVINIWFDTNVSQAPDMTLTYDNGNWTPSTIKDEIVDNLKSSGELKFFWEGSNSWNSWVSLTSSSFSYKPASGVGFPRCLRQSGNGSDNVYQFDKTTNTLTATLKWDYATNVQVVVEGIKADEGFTLKCSGGLWSAGSISVNETNIALSSGDGAIYGVANEENATAFYFVLTEAGEKTLTFTLTNPNGSNSTRYVVSKNFTFTDQQAQKNFFAARLNRLNFYSTMSYEHPYVVMGYNMYWSIMNIGANSPQDPGDYFAWGETETYYSSKNPFVWKENKSGGYATSSYRFYENGAYTTYTRDGVTTLSEEDDAAKANWGGKWRMPTESDWKNLLNNCEWDPVYNSETGAFLGYNVTASNKNRIFLPVTGFMYNTSITGIDPTAPQGDYWSSSLSPSPATPENYVAQYLYFTSEKKMTYSQDRSFGMVIRPVSD